MKDRRTLVMIAVLVLLGVLGGLYLFMERDGDSGGGVSMGAAAIVALLVLAFVAAGASRGKRVVRDEEERENG